MSQAAPVDRVWLVGGGLSSPWAYGRLLDSLGESACPARVSVAGVLVELTRTVVQQGIVALNAPGWEGEGQFEQVGTDGSALSLDHLQQSWTVHNRASITLATSGSTGAPKTITHRLRTLTRSLAVGERHHGDVWGLAFNPTHIAGVQVYFQALANLNTIVNLWGIDRAEILARCREWKVTHLSATPTFYRLLLPLEEPITSVRSVSIGGESADARLIERLRASFPNAKVHNIYASTEAGTLLVSDGDEFSLPGQQDNLQAVPEITEGRRRDSSVSSVACCESMGRSPVVRIHDGRLWVHRRMLGQFPAENAESRRQKAGENGESEKRDVEINWFFGELRGSN